MPLDPIVAVEGDVATVHGDEHYVWGRVTTWEPPTRYTHCDALLARFAAHVS